MWSKRGTRRVACHSLVATAAITGLAICDSPAAAQSTAPSSNSEVATSPSASQAPDGGIPDIVVTARYRKESVQSTPVAITALNANELAGRGIVSVSDIGNAVPNVTIQPSPANGGKSAYTLIRGVRQTDANFAFEPGVAIYIDQVYLGTVFGSQLDLMDTGRVEVLRGPQGTLFGRNSEGGAIRINSVEPKGDNSGYLEGGYGSFSHFRLRGAADIGLVKDRVMLRVAGGINKSDGYVNLLDFACANPGAAGNLKPTTASKNCRIGTLGGEDTKFIQGTLRLQPSDALQIDLRGSYLDDGGENVPQRLLAVIPGDPDAAPNTTAGQIYFLGQRFIADPNVGIPFDNRFVTNNFYSSYSAFSNLLSNKQIPNRAPVRSWTVSGIVNWTISDNVSLHSVTAYQHYTGVIADPGAAPLSTGSAYSPYGTASSRKKSHCQVRMISSRDLWNGPSADSSSTAMTGSSVTTISSCCRRLGFTSNRMTRRVIEAGPYSFTFSTIPPPNWVSNSAIDIPSRKSATPLTT